jgi:hypothetical protein
VAIAATVAVAMTTGLDDDILGGMVKKELGRESSTLVAQKPGL